MSEKTKLKSTTFADLLPPLSTDEFNALKADIKANGVRDPVWIDEDGNVLDGRHRLKIDPKAPTRIAKGLTEAQKEAFVWRSNFATRNLSPEVKRELDKQRRATAIRLRDEDCLTQAAIARELGAPRQTVSDWLSKTRSNAGSGNASTVDVRVKIPKKARPVVAAEVASGKPQVQVAADYGVSQRQISNIVAAEKKRIAKQHEQERARGGSEEREGLIDDLASVAGQWRCIYADPPWSYGDSGVAGGGVAHQYKSMSVDAISGLTVGELAHEEGAHLWLWTTWPMIRERAPHAVLDAWGFQWKGEIVWHKLSTRRQETFFGVGRWLRPATEVLIFAVRKGEKAKRPPPLLRTGKELLGFCSHSVLGHSRKPERFRQLIEKLSPGSRIELFARRAAPGWSRWGDQA